MGRIDWHGAKAKSTPKNSLSEYIGKRILQARQAGQITLRELSKSSGISAAFLCDLENGKRSPSAETLWKLSRATGKPFSWWLKGYRE